MYDTVSFVIPGEPCAKGRPRFTRAGHAYTPAKTQAYEALVQACYAQSKRLYFEDQGLRVTVCTKFAIPKSASKRRAQDMREGRILPTKRPDADNLAKAICDALNGVAWKDDCQVTHLDVRKRYADEPMVIVMIRPDCAEEDAP